MKLPKLRTVLLLAAGATVVYIGYKAYRGDFTLLGNKNPLNTDEKKVAQPITDERKLQLQGIITTLQGKLDGVIASNENKAALQQQLDEAWKEVQQNV